MSITITIKSEILTGILKGLEVDMSYSTTSNAPQDPRKVGGVYKSANGSSYRVKSIETSIKR